MSNFDWQNDESIVHKTMYGISVCVNEDNEIQITQHDPVVGEDREIYIAPVFSDAICEAIKKAAKEAE